MLMVPFFWSRQRKMQKKVDFLTCIFVQIISDTMRDMDSGISVWVSILGVKVLGFIAQAYSFFEILTFIT